MSRKIRPKLHLKSRMAHELVVPKHFVGIEKTVYCVTDSHPHLLVVNCRVIPEVKVAKGQIGHGSTVGIILSFSGVEVVALSPEVENGEVVELAHMFAATPTATKE